MLLLDMVLMCLVEPLVQHSRVLARSFLRQTRHAGDIQREFLLRRIARHAFAPAFDTPTIPS